MAEIWGAALAVQAGGAIIGGIAKSKQAKADRKNAKADRKEMTADEAKWQSLLSQFDTEQGYRYEQLRRRNKQRGLDEFRKFHSLGAFAPEYAQTNGNIVVPEARTIGQMADEYDKTQAKIDAANGAALGKKDPVRKAPSKLF